MNRDSYYGNAIQQQQTGGRGDHWGLLAGESRRSNLPIIPNHTFSYHTNGIPWGSKYHHSHCDTVKLKEI